MAKKQFKAESKRLLDLMIDSIYTHQEIFLREIISNASDAIDKLAYLSLTDQNVGLDRNDFAIDIHVDKEHGILTVSDNGIGMSKEEMENNLGTIAKSGSLQFKQQMQKQTDIDIIGQFGVGFYSAFMVADTVTVLSKKYGSEEAWLWQSSGADGYTIEQKQKTTVGTDVIMKLKPDTDDEKYSRFLEQFQLQSLIKKYSDYIRYPIRMELEKSRIKEDTKDSETPSYETYSEISTLNSMIPLWQRAKSDVSTDEYESFYREKFFDFEKPLANIHVSVEGAVTYKALLYIPAAAPYDYYTKDFKKGLQLYSSGVMIMEKCEDLIPEHFRFVRGVVDSQDLSLNISREMLQHNRQLSLIATNLEKKIKAELLKLQENSRTDYEKFYAAFGRQLKYAIVSDYGMHKELLQDLLLFWSSKENKLVTLKEYVNKMPDEQKKIYFAAGESKIRLAKLPQTEVVMQKGFDVLYMTDDVDEFVPRTLMTFMDKEFCNVAVDELGLTDEKEKADKEETTSIWQPTLDFLQKTLENKIKKAEISTELGSHPVCLVPDGGMSFEMEKYMHRVDPNFEMNADKILKINPAHSICALLRDNISKNEAYASDLANVLYTQGLLLADLPIDDAASYTELICRLIV